MNELIKNVGVLQNFKEWPSAKTFWGNKTKNFKNVKQKLEPLSLIKIIKSIIFLP